MSLPAPLPHGWRGVYALDPSNFDVYTWVLQAHGLLTAVHGGEGNGYGALVVRTRAHPYWW